MKTWEQRLRESGKKDKYKQLKCKNELRRFWLLMYSDIRTHKGVTIDNYYSKASPRFRKFAVIANRIYKRR